MHGVELAETARLKQRRDKQSIGAGVDAVCARLVILDAGAEAAVIKMLIIPEGVLIPLVARAENDNLRIFINDL